MLDLNTQLANFALTCVGKAEGLRWEAGQIRAENPPSGDAQYDALSAIKIRQLTSEAAAWDARAAEARRGFLLVDADDIKFQWDNHALYSECIAASRVRYGVPVVSPVVPMPTRAG